MEEYQKQLSLLSQELWYHHSLSRLDAQNLIKKNGEFLVRESSHVNKQFILTVKWNGRFIHLVAIGFIRLGPTGLSTWCYTFETVKQPTIPLLVKYHWLNQLPMTRKSEAVIFRPVNRIDASSIGSLRRILFG